ncbi:hypothetical protein KUT50_19470 [Pseudomonas aeruginosa]|uniref:hypothetical protein n=1 Tax=Pseudomonas aeruginosa TaxID=287 RepID=UPI00058622D0|nr:hypothetical protein [Pseudomonas aeruginosa]AJD59836.1 hypothetical protein F22031_04505 [Pseudomonas aeruginosa]EKU1969311.1 hypothetical protein [Pseudomonas aeruginosa]EKX9350474.1 hypothetical protein [Pseudomonas aeruginosa]EKY1829997.1 hypothetical protein [Pseudomonas aeruginosa]ELD5770401.1 hypothetical protein [Pseudomonas aeruginosa]
MSYSDPRHCHNQRVTQWLAAIRQHAAWLYAADEQYLYLVAEANELYQCGVIGLQDRHDMVTDALGMYSWAIEHGITRETHYCADCCYDVIDGGRVVGSVDDEGIYHGPAPARQRQGYISRDPLDGQVYLRLGQALDRAGVVHGLEIKLDAGGTLLLVEQIPSDFRPWRWPP